MKRLLPAYLSICCIFFFLIAAPSPTKAAKEKAGTKSLPIASWLKNGPIPTQLPVFHSVKNIKGKEFGLLDLLEFEHADITEWWPREGESILWFGDTPLQWTLETADSNGLLLQSTPSDSLPEIAYLASYLDAKRFTKAQLEVSGFHLFQILLDGEVVETKKAADVSKKDSTEVKSRKKTKEIKLPTGKHLLLIKTLKDPKCDSVWNIRAELQIPKDWQEDDLVISTSPKQIMTIKHLLDGPKMIGISISPDGELVTINYRQSLPPSDKSETWIELRRVKDGDLLQTFRGGMQISNINWSPKGRRFSYKTSEKEESTLWIVDLAKGTTTPLLKNVKHLRDHAWSPDGSFIIYGVTEKPEKDKTGLKKLQGMPDRWPEWRDRTFLYQVNVSTGTRRRLTSGKLSTALNSISPNGIQLLFARSIIEYKERPFSKTELSILNLKTLQQDSLWTSKWADGALWSPDGKKLLVTGGPSAFNGIGKKVPEGMIPNEYDIQTFIYDLSTKAIEPISRDFNPAINQAFWSKTEERIYFTTTDRSYRTLYCYDLKTKQFKSLNTGVEFINKIDIAEEAPIAVYIGSGPAVPPKAYTIDLRKNQCRLLFNANTDYYKDVRFDKVEQWIFKNNAGTDIEGRVYYPPAFNPNKKYPCIVYYYGGTTPVSRAFGGRYPKELYAANGYVVYVLQTSGAIGFGQEFSALHVNNWGITVADEIIHGVKQFLAAHPFVDEKRVGCIGASYGGFLTMLLITRTDIFTAAVSHAGISSISSYWGEGFWGYLYSALATANSFPWNRKDIYIDQSPLFHADKVNTPLLLLHGAVDTNVPPGESIQFYTALKLLGKEVELIKVEGQNHWILEYNKRIRWTRSILAWFDRWLKEEPEWWADLYSDEKE